MADSAVVELAVTLVGPVLGFLLDPSVPDILIRKVKPNGCLPTTQIEVTERVRTVRRQNWVPWLVAEVRVRRKILGLQRLFDGLLRDRIKAVPVLCECSVLELTETIGYLLKDL